MSANCVLCERDDWLDVGICAACAGADDHGELVFLAASATATDRMTTERTLRELIGGPLEQRFMGDVVRGRQPLVLLPSSLTRRAVRVLDDSGVRARSLPRATAHRAVPLSFALMVFTMLMVGSVGALRGLPLLLSASAFVAALLVLLAFRVLRSPLVPTATSSALLPRAARAALATALTELDDADARKLLVDITRTGEATFAALPDAFRSAALGTAVVELLCEAGPLAREAAQLRAIAHELESRDESRHGEELRLVGQAASARYALLEDVLALLSRLARDGARSDEEVVRLLQLVRDEAARRVEAEHAVAALLQETPAGN